VSDRSTSERGYGAEHRKLREAWRPVVEAGGTTCPRCRRKIRPGQAWDLGHAADRATYNGPEHASCNRAAGVRSRFGKRDPEPHPGTQS
jgi:hypothetical protein